MAEPIEDGPLGPVCPICPADKPVHTEPNIGAAGGFICGNCSFLFDGGDREALNHRTQRRRDMWAAETGTTSHGRPQAPPKALAAARAALDDARNQKEDPQQVTRPTTSTRAEEGTTAR